MTFEMKQVAKKNRSALRIGSIPDGLDSIMNHISMKEAPNDRLPFLFLRSHLRSLGFLMKV